MRPFPVTQKRSASPDAGYCAQLKPYMRNANALDRLYGNHLYELSVDWTNISPVMKVLYGNRTVLYGIRTFCYSSHNRIRSECGTRYLATSGYSPLKVT
jgi:hypothetical protein